MRKNIIEQKRKKVNELKSKSDKALDVITSTIDNLSKVNEAIDNELTEIKEIRKNLQDTEEDLNKTRLHNTKISEKFRMLIED